jgi:2-acylglycerol O-acyltransferase 2
VFRLQKKFQKMFGFTLPLFYGRGIFNCEQTPSRRTVIVLC